MNKKFIVYGFKHPYSTHHFIHLAVQRAITNLNYKVYWLDYTHQLDSDFFDDSIIFAEGWETDKLPVAKNSVYIIHHFGTKLSGRFEYNSRYITNNNKVFDLRFLCEKFEDHNQKWDVNFKSMIKIDHCTYLEIGRDYNFIYQPWATDLLPHEINENDVYIPKEKKIYYLGTISNGWQNEFIPSWKLDNKTDLEKFIQACGENEIEFIENNPIKNPLSIQECKNLCQKSYMSPDIRDKHKLEVGYIPCRIFKNISYGNLGMTNSKTVYEFFDQNVAYHSDPYELFYVGERLKTDYKKLIDMTNFVKSNHTYVNRIKSLLKIVYE